MNEFTAKTVLEDKFWVVESAGKQIASIQQSLTGITLIGRERKERFTDRAALKAKYNIVFDTTKQIEGPPVTEIYDFPCKSKPYNDLFDVSRGLPIFTETEKSKSYLCAGYYLIKDRKWKVEYCPKLLTLSRYEYVGPFKTAEQAKQGPTNKWFE